MLPDKKKFQQTLYGKPVDLFYLNNGDMQAAITNYGGRLVSLIVPDKNGTPTDVNAGFSSLHDYRNSSEPYYGALIGRYANRIANAQFSLEGIAHQLEPNNGPNQLHGGKNGFHLQVWDARQVSGAVLELTYCSKDGEENYPGNLAVTVTYTLTPGNGLQISYAAVTDKTTILNLTAHPFFNLNGEGSGTILNHVLTIRADHYNPVDANVLATGETAPVTNTPFDFRQPVSIGGRLTNGNEQLQNGNGYDHNFILNKGLTQQPETAAVIEGDLSGISMEVLTTEPGLQFYSGNFMKGEYVFKSGSPDDFRTTFCLEAQHFPDSPNHPGFPTTVLKPGEIYTQKTIYRFSTQEDRDAPAA